MTAASSEEERKREGEGLLPRERRRVPLAKVTKPSTLERAAFRAWVKGAGESTAAQAKPTLVSRHGIAV